MMLGNTTALILAVICFGLSGVGQARAAMDLGNERLRVSGFGTLGLIKAGDDLLGYRRDMSKDGVFDGDVSFQTDSLLGLQFDARLTGEIDATLQMVAMDRVDNTLQNSVEWAFVRYRPHRDWVIRGGRTGVDLFALSDYRNVGFAYLWVRPPVEFYGPLAFDYIDGLDVTYSQALKAGRLQLKLLGGKAENVFTTKLGDTEVDLNPVLGFNLTWESDPWRARLGTVSVEMDSQIKPAQQLQVLLSNPSLAMAWPEAPEIAEALNPIGRSLYYYSGGISYDAYPWLVQSELGFIDSDYDYFLPLLSAYLSVGRRLQSLTLYAVAAIARNTEDRRQLPAPSISTPAVDLLYRSTQEFYDRSPIDQHTLSLGVRWDLREDLALKMQWDHHWVAAYGGGLWIQEQPLTEDRELNTLSANLNFVF